MLSLSNKIVLVTGAAGGIGAAIGAAIRDAGGTCIATDLSPGAGLDHALDVSQEENWRGVIEAIEAAQGRLDGVVNAAGILVVGNVEEVEFAQWRRVMAVNLDGAFLGCKYAMPLLRKAGGSIVNLSSVSGLVGGYNLAAYSASKGGLSLLTKSVALYGARLNPPVRCNAVCPAFVEGPMVDSLLSAVKDAKVAREKLPRDIPLGRLGKPSEIAALCVYLLSDAAAFITGADMPIDGGLTAR